MKLRDGSAHLCALTAAALWGLAGVLNKEQLLNLPSAQLVIVQIATSTVVTWIALLKYEEVEISSDTMTAFLLGLLHPGLSNVVGLIGLAHLSASFSSVIWALEASLTMLVAALILGERMRLLDIVFSTIALTGICIIATGPGGTMPVGSSLGAIQTFFAVLCCAVHAVLSRHFAAATRANLMLVLAGQQTVGIAFCAIVLPFHWSFTNTVPVEAIDVQSWCLILATGIVKFLIATGLYLAALSRLPAGQAGNYLVLTPVFGLLAASVMLSEHLAPVQWLGTLMVLLAVASVQFKSWWIS